LPTFNKGIPHASPHSKPALDAVFEAGLSAPTTNYEAGGMQLPPIVANVANAYLTAVAGMTIGYVSLTHANCNLIEAHGSTAQIDRWVKPMREGRFAGTMAMTEPGAGSGLADLTTTAERQDDGSYRISGNKFLSRAATIRSTTILCIWYWPELKVRPKVLKVFRCLSYPNFWLAKMVSRAHVMKSHCLGYFIKWRAGAILLARSILAKMTVRLVSWSAKNTKACRTCFT
jgi:hypothetical protein